MSREHIPICLRTEDIPLPGPEPGPQKLYACAELVDGGFGFWHGPTPRETDMLNSVGESTDSVVVRLVKDGDPVILWRWDGEDRWVEEDAMGTPNAPKSSIFKAELEALINMHSRENASNTPDRLLAQYILWSLEAFENIVNAREMWYGRSAPPGWAPDPDEEREVPNES